jgi:universal stress protein A
MATDFSEASEPAWRRALSIAAENDAALYLVHAYEPPNLIHTGGLVPGNYEAWDQNVRAAANEKLDDLVAEAAGMGIQADRAVEAGFPEEAIVQAARDFDADLIVMGTHGRRGVSRMFLGSVAARVVATAPCPVLTVRVPELRKSSRLAADA